MKTRKMYYEIWDTTRRVWDPNHANFGSIPSCNDVAGLVVSFARRNKVKASDVRLFFFETKKMWDTMRECWLQGVDWTLPALP